MPLTESIPARALALVDILRRDVPRPTELPTPRWETSCLRWPALEPGGTARNVLGLHHLSESPNPARTWIPGIDWKDVSALSYWWDEQTDALAAVNAIWHPPAGSPEWKEIAR